MCIVLTCSHHVSVGSSCSVPPFSRMTSSISWAVTNSPIPRTRSSPLPWRFPVSWTWPGSVASASPLSRTRSPPVSGSWPGLSSISRAWSRPPSFSGTWPPPFLGMRSPSFSGPWSSTIPVKKIIQVLLIHNRITCTWQGGIYPYIPHEPF